MHPYQKIHPDYKNKGRNFRSAPCQQERKLSNYLQTLRNLRIATNPTAPIIISAPVEGSGTTAAKVMPLVELSMEPTNAVEPVPDAKVYVVVLTSIPEVVGIVQAELPITPTCKSGSEG